MKNKNKSSDRGKVKEIVEDEETIEVLALAKRQGQATDNL